MSAPKLRDWAGVKTRYIVGRDTDYTFEEADGGPMPMSEERYQGNEYMSKAAPETHNRKISYVEYVQYYGNPDRHVALYLRRQDRCPCCDHWIDGDALYGIDVMDDTPEAQFDADERGLPWRLEDLTGYLKEVAADLDIDADLLHRAPDCLTDAADRIVLCDLLTRTLSVLDVQRDDNGERIADGNPELYAELQRCRKRIGGGK